MSSTRNRPRWFVVVYPILGIVVLDVAYQIAISWRQAHIIATADPVLLLLAVFNQLAMYVVLVPAMQEFYETTGIILSGKRTFSMLTIGLAFARIIPTGEYMVWRASLRKHRGAASATTQWLILYYTWMFCGLLVMFVAAEIVTLLLYRHAHVNSLVGNLRFLPVGLSFLVLMGLFATRFQGVRELLRRLAFDKLGSQAVSPLGIIKERGIGRNVLGALTFASLASWLIEGFTLFLCLRSIGVEVPIVIAVFGFSFARLFSIVPLTPGGIGQIETGAALFFAAYGYPVGVVVTGTLLYRLITYWPPLVVGAVMYKLAPGPMDLADLARPVFASQLHKRRAVSNAEFAAAVRQAWHESVR